MAIRSKMIAPSNGIFFVSDQNLPSSPMFTSERIEIVANESCILVPCQHEVDGDAQLIVGEYEHLPQSGMPVFDQLLLTPGKLLVCSDVAGEHLLSFPLQTVETHVRIWTDGLEFPTRVVIGVG